MSKKGFTLAETLVALVILGIILVGVTSIMSGIATAAKRTDEVTFENSDSLYVLGLFQDTFYKTISVDVSEKELLCICEESAESFEFEGNKLFYNSKPLADILSGSFVYNNDNSVSISILFANRTSLSTKFYPKGEQLDA